MAPSENEFDTPAVGALRILHLNSDYCKVGISDLQLQKMKQREIK